MLCIINLSSRPDRRHFMRVSCAEPLAELARVEFVDGVEAADVADTPAHPSFELDGDAIERLLDAWHATGCEPVARTALERYYVRLGVS